jgi:serine/threonine-protein kinase
MFYEALAGGRPFASETPFGILRLHLTEVPAPPSARRAAVPPELDRIVLRLLKKAAAERYPAAEDLLLELRDFLNRAA